MIWNLGSINADNFYYLRHLPAPGETIAAYDFQQGLGGKGTNMSVAVARAGARIAHIGAVGADGKWAVERLMEYGVDTRHITVVPQPTGHANICVADDGENNIVLQAGANHAVTDEMIGAALTEASPGDFLLMQNETLGQQFSAGTAKTLGLRVAYAAAPFSAEIALTLIDLVDILILNEGEADALEEAAGTPLSDMGIPDVIVTRGAQGCRWFSKSSSVKRDFAAFEITPVDTTGAGDTFTGYLLAALDRRLTMEDAITLGMQAGALMATRQGTADVIPDLKDIQDHRFD